MVQHAPLLPVVLQEVITTVVTAQLEYLYFQSTPRPTRKLFCILTTPRFIQRAPQGGQGGPDHETINGPLMFQYLLAMLSQGRNGGTPGVLPGMFPPGAEGGRWGDYVFNQEGIVSVSPVAHEPNIDTNILLPALDQIITQLMENSQSHPVPATEEIMQKLPREVLTEECTMVFFCSDTIPGADNDVHQHHY